MNKLLGGIEFGGTKTVCAVGYASGEIISSITIPTTSIEETLRNVYDFFSDQKPIAALGVGSFGPLNIDRNSENYGSIYNSPKKGWEEVDLKELLGSYFKIPMEFDLDVNCAALGELYFGVAKNMNSFVYLTIGTGIGGSLVVNKQVVYGILNLEMGHMRIPSTISDGYKGVCEYHGDCLEGIASGYAMQQRYGQRAEEIISSDIWDLEANYIALALNNIIMTTGPEKIILGGGIINHNGLIEQVRLKLNPIINGYLHIPNLDDYIVKSSGDMNGVLGAIKLVASSFVDATNTIGPDQ